MFVIKKIIIINVIILFLPKGLKTVKYEMEFINAMQ